MLVATACTAIPAAVAALNQTDLIRRGLDTESVYIGHTFIERAVVPKILSLQPKQG